MGASIRAGGAGVLASSAPKPTLVAPDNHAAGHLNPFAESLYTDWVGSGRAPEDLIAGLRSARTGKAFGEVRDYVNGQANAVFPDKPQHVGEAVLAFMNSGALFVMDRAAFGTVRVLEDMLAATTTRAEVAEAALVTAQTARDAAVADNLRLAAALSVFLDMGAAVTGLGALDEQLRQVGEWAGRVARGEDPVADMMAQAAALASAMADMRLPLAEVLAAFVEATQMVAGESNTLTLDAVGEAETEASVVQEPDAPSQTVPQDWIDAATTQCGDDKKHPKFQRIPAEIRQLLIVQSAQKPAASEQVFFKRARQKLSDFGHETLQGLTTRVAEHFPHLTSEEAEVMWAVLYGRIEVYLRGEMANPRDPEQQLAPRVSDMHRQFDRWIGLAAGALQHVRAHQSAVLPVPSGAGVVDATVAEIVEPVVTPPSEAAMMGGGAGGQEGDQQSAPEPAADSDAIVAEITSRDRAVMKQRVDSILRRVEILRGQISGDHDDATALRNELGVIGEAAQSQRTLIDSAVGEMWAGIVDSVTQAENDFVAAKTLATDNGILPDQSLPARGPHPGNTHTRRGVRDGERRLAAESRGGVWPEIPGVSLTKMKADKNLPDKQRKKMVEILRGAPEGLKKPTSAWWRQHGVSRLKGSQNFYEIRVTQHTNNAMRILVYWASNGTVHVRFAGGHGTFDRIVKVGQEKHLAAWASQHDGAP